MRRWLEQTSLLPITFLKMTGLKGGRQIVTEVKHLYENVVIPNKDCSLLAERTASTISLSFRGRGADDNRLCRFTLQLGHSPVETPAKSQHWNFGMYHASYACVCEREKSMLVEAT